MDVSTIDPKVLTGILVLLGVLILAAVGRWALNVRDDIEDWQEEKEEKERSKRGEKLSE